MSQFTLTRITHQVVRAFDLNIFGNEKGEKPMKMFWVIMLSLFLGASGNQQLTNSVEMARISKTPFVAQFIGKSSIIEEYGKLKGFDSIGPDTKAIIRPEFVEIKSPKDVTEQSSIYEQAAVEQSIFRGNYFEVLLNIKGITIRTNSPLVNGPLKSGDKVWVVINQMYVFDDKTTTTLTNKGLDVSSMYYI